MGVLYTDNFESDTAGSPVSGWTAPSGTFFTGGAWLATASNPIHQTQSYAQAVAVDGQGMLYTGAGTLADMDVRFCFKFRGTASVATNANAAMGVYLRGNTNGSGYFIYPSFNAGISGNLNLQCLSLYPIPASIGNSLLTTSQILGRLPIDGDVIWIRGQIVGTQIYAKMWLDGQAEPGQWHLSLTDSTFSAAGYPGFRVSGTYAGNAGEIDDFTFATVPTAYTPPLVALNSVTGTTASLTAAAPTGGTSPYTYQWYRGNYSNFLWGNFNGTALSGQTSLTLNDTGLTTGKTYYYICVATDSTGAVAASQPIPATTGVTSGSIARTTNGLLLQDNFANLSKWTPAGASWSASSAFPSYCLWGTQEGLLQPGQLGQPDGGGMREPHWMWDTVAQIFRIWYGAGNGTSGSGGPWRPQYAKSFDGGLSWTKYGTINGWAFTNGPNQPYGAGDLSGYISYNSIDGYYYFQLVGAASASGSPAVIPGAPYYNLIYRATNLDGPWTYYAYTPALGSSGSYDDEVNLTSSVWYTGSEWMSVGSSNGSASSPNTAVSTSSSSPGGPWTSGGSPLFSSTNNNNYGSLVGGTENPKYWFSTALNSAVLFFNDIVSSSVASIAAARAAIVTAPTLADMANTGLSFKNVILFPCLTPDVYGGSNPSTPNAITVLAPLTDQNGNVLQDSNGYVPAVWGGGSSRDLTDANVGTWQKLFGGALEPSPNCLSFTGTSDYIYSVVTNGNAVHEFVMEPEAYDEDNIIVLQYGWRITNNGGNNAIENGYFLNIQFHTGSGSMSLEFYKIVSGTQTLISSATIPANFDPFTATGYLSYQSKFKIVANGSNHTVYLNDTIIIQASDSSITSGPNVVFTAGTASGPGSAHARLLNVRSSDTVTLSGLPANAQVVMRAPGAGTAPGVPAAQATADGSGNATITHYHYPMGSFDVNGTNVVPSNYIYGGDSYAFSSGPPPPPVVSGAASVLYAGSTVASVIVGAASSGTSPYTYQWYRSTASGFTPGSGNIISGATSLILNDTVLTNGTAYYYKNVVTDATSGTAISNQISLTPSAGGGGGVGTGGGASVGIGYYPPGIGI